MRIKWEIVDLSALWISKDWTQISFALTEIVAYLSGPFHRSLLSVHWKMLLWVRVIFPVSHGWQHDLFLDGKLLWSNFCLRMTQIVAYHLQGYQWENNEEIVNWLTSQMDADGNINSQSIVATNIKCVVKDAILSQIKTSTQDIPEVAREAVVELFSGLSSQQKADILRTLSHLEEKESWFLLPASSGKQNEEKNRKQGCGK